jgi:preprotein translocase subunit SecF
MGRAFFIKCLVAIAIAAIGIIIYVAIRFRKIGGTSAGVMAVVALIHDVLMVYFVFIIFRIPLNDSFIAVVLTILGYSVNDTIVVYDRIRENRRLFGVKEALPKILNLSLNQDFSRSVYTSMMTFIAISTVFVVGILYGINSIVTFALPMMVGVLFGCYSSLYIAGPLYTMWQVRKSSQKAA